MPLIASTVIHCAVELLSWGHNPRFRECLVDPMMLNGADLAIKGISSPLLLGYPLVLEPLIEGGGAAVAVSHAVVLPCVPTAGSRFIGLRGASGVVPLRVEIQ